MKILRCMCGFAAGSLCAQGADEFFDRVQDALTFSAAQAPVRARLSGAIDLEGYDIPLPAPGLLRSTRDQFVAPRLTVFLDAQFGSQVYVFAQGRADRGFDPGDSGREVRLDEYAVRFMPWRGTRFNVQVGKFATVVGNWTARHGSWSNPFITAPLPYENLTGIWDTEALRATGVLLQWSHVRPGLPTAITAQEKSLRIPIIWGPSYATGVAIAGDVGKFGYALEAKLGALSSRPEIWAHAADEREHPTTSTRVTWRPNQMWTLGASASRGPYLRDLATRSLPVGLGRGDYTESVLAQDIAFAWHHWQIWSEIYGARFNIPRVGHADTLAYYTEVKYKFTPQLFGAVRWNQQVYGTLPDRAGSVSWGHDVWRADVAPGFRFNSHTQVKIQYSLQHGDRGAHDYARTLAGQFTVRF